MNSIFSFLKKNIKTFFMLVFLLGVIYVEFVVIESFNFHSVVGMDKSIVRLNLIVIFTFFCIYYALFCRFDFACIGMTITMLLWGLFNCYVIRFRGRPISAADINSAKTALNVANEYSFFPSNKMVMLSVFMVIIIVVCMILPFKGSVITCKKSFQRIAALVEIILFYWLFFMSDKPETWGMNFSGLFYSDACQVYGYPLAFTISATQLKMKKPDGYSADEVDRIISNFNYDNSKNKLESGQKLENPNIIVIVNESYSTVGAEFAENTIEKEFLKTTSGNIIKGSLYVSIFGGNTPNTEFEFLTGNSMAFQPNDTIPFLMLNSQIPSLNYILKEQGFSGMNAYHPCDKNNWNRNEAYNYLGFDEFLSEEDFTDASNIRDYTSDESVYKKLIYDYEELKTETENPVFLYAMTMQNHGGYTNELTSFPQARYVVEEIPDDLNLYLNLISISDDALSGLIHYYEKKADPTVILFFGDHQPSLSDECEDYIYYKSDPLEKYVVPFYLWANYDIPEIKIDKISVNYLSSLLLNVSGCRMTAYNKYLLKLYENIPCITANGYMGNDGVFYQIDDPDSPYYELIRDYRFLQYNNMYDKLNYNQDFFEKLN